MSDYKVYHDTFTSAVAEAKLFAENSGYTVCEGDWFAQIETGPGRPSTGQTHKFHVFLRKDGKIQKKLAHFQVYNTGNSYELNCYIL